MKLEFLREFTHSFTHFLPCSLQIFKELLSRDHDSQNLVHVNKKSRLIQKRYMYLEIDELFVT